MQSTAADSMTIRWNLAYLMLDRNIKTGDLAKIVGLHANTISKLKSYREMPPRLDRETLDGLCKALGCQPGDLLTYEASQEAIEIEANPKPTDSEAPQES